MAALYTEGTTQYKKLTAIDNMLAKGITSNILDSQAEVSEDDKIRMEMRTAELKEGIVDLKTKIHAMQQLDQSLRKKATKHE